MGIMQVLLNKLPWVGRVPEAVVDLYADLERQSSHDWFELIWRRTYAVVSHACASLPQQLEHAACATGVIMVSQGRLWRSAKREDLDIVGRWCRRLVELIRADMPPEEQPGLDDRVRVCCCIVPGAAGRTKGGGSDDSFLCLCVWRACFRSWWTPTSAWKPFWGRCDCAGSFACITRTMFV